MIHEEDESLRLSDSDFGIDETINDYFDDIEDENDSELSDEYSSNKHNFKGVYRGNLYLPPDILMTEFERSLELNEPTEKLIEYFMLIASNVVYKLKLKSKLDEDSCIGFAVSRAWETKWKKYDENRSQNIFSFFTTVLLNDMKTHKTKILTRYHSKFVYTSNLE